LPLFAHVVTASHTRALADNLSLWNNSRKLYRNIKQSRNGDIELKAMGNAKDIRSLTDFQRNTKAHMRRLKETGLPEKLTVNGKVKLIVQNAAAYYDMIAAIRGIERGLVEMKAGKGEPARKVLARIRAKHEIPQTKKHQGWIDEALAGSFKPGNATRLRRIAAKARASTDHVDKSRRRAINHGHATSTDTNLNLPGRKFYRPHP
jgi:hypothetical protein